MARFDTSGFADLIKEMKDLGELSGEVADDMLLAGAEEVKAAWKQSAEEHELRDTGDMIDSIGYARKPKSINGIREIDIYPQGTDRKGVRNAEKAFILHYGTSSVEATEWVDRADELSAEPAERAMRKIWENELDRRKM